MKLSNWTIGVMDVISLFYIVKRLKKIGLKTVIYIQIRKTVGKFKMNVRQLREVNILELKFLKPNRQVIHSGPENFKIPGQKTREIK